MAFKPLSGSRGLTPLGGAPADAPDRPRIPAQAPAQVPTPLPATPRARTDAPRVLGGVRPPSPVQPAAVGRAPVVQRDGLQVRPDRQVLQGPQRSSTDVSLTVLRGARSRGCSGPNGAGKTTCFYMITGLIPADYGVDLRLDGEDITGQPMYQRARLGVGYLPQEASIFRGMTVEQNVKAVVELRETRRPAAQAEARPTACWRSCTSATCAARSRRRSLSGGERRVRDRPRSLASDAPASCCWTSRSPASTPWPSPIFKPGDPLPGRTKGSAC